MTGLNISRPTKLPPHHPPYPMTKRSTLLTLQQHMQIRTLGREFDALAWLRIEVSVFVEVRVVAFVVFGRRRKVGRGDGGGVVRGEFWLWELWCGGLEEREGRGEFAGGED